MNQDRFLSQIELSDECWLWTGPVNNRGYGQYGHGRRHSQKAHRIAYELFRGPIPDGMEIDHLCKVKLCVNPSHLEPVTALENVRRRWETYTHCKHGHEFTTENTRIRSDGFRDCRTCSRHRAKERRVREVVA